MSYNVQGIFHTKFVWRFNEVQLRCLYFSISFY